MLQRWLPAPFFSCFCLSCSSLGTAASRLCCSLLSQAGTWPSGISECSPWWAFHGPPCLGVSVPHNPSFLLLHHRPGRARPVSAQLERLLGLPLVPPTCAAHPQETGTGESLQNLQFPFLNPPVTVVSLCLSPLHAAAVSNDPSPS